jgi:hypothetical protein
MEMCSVKLTLHNFFYITFLVIPYLYHASLLDHDKQWDFTDVLYSEGQTTGIKSGASSLKT